LGGLLGSVAGSAVGVRLAASHDGQGPSFWTGVKGGLIGVIPGLVGAAVTFLIAGSDAAAWVGFAVGQGGVNGMYAAAHTPH
jgi:hypothetical protein